MSEKQDRRILRTKQLLRDVLLELMMEIGLENVTVKELTERAGLNRGTFYLHYQDIYDFCEQYTAEILEGFYNVIKKLSLSHNIQGPFVEPPYGYIKPFDYVVENEKFFKVFLGSGGNSSFEFKLKEMINEQFHNSFRLRNDLVQEIPVKQQYVFAYLSSAYVGTLQFWIAQGMNMSSKDIAVLFSQISQLGSSNL